MCIRDRIETEELAHLIADILDAHGDDAAITRVRSAVERLTARFPVYQAQESGVR